MNLIVWLRSFSSPALDTILGYVTDLGSTMFYLVAVPIVYWCINRRAGYVIGMTVLAGGVCTDLAKAAISARPRSSRKRRKRRISSSPSGCPTAARVKL